MITKPHGATAQRTIHLTDHAPIRITADAWLTIASSRRVDEALDFPNDREWTLRVRRHEDGRTVVYGAFSSRIRGETPRRGGELLKPGGDVHAAVRRVTETIGADRELARDCIADLPPAELARAHRLSS